jgi:hypothetical protein
VACMCMGVVIEFQLEWLGPAGCLCPTPWPTEDAAWPILSNTHLLLLLQIPLPVAQPVRHVERWQWPGLAEQHDWRRRQRNGVGA